MNVNRVFVIVDKEGVPVGMPYLFANLAERDLANSREGLDEARGPYSVAEFRREELDR